MKKYVNRLRRNCKIRNACFAHAHFRLFFPSAYAAAAAAAHFAHGRIVVYLFHQWLCFTGQVCRFLKKSRSYRKIFFFIHPTEVFHSRTRSIQGAPTLQTFSDSTILKQISNHRCTWCKSLRRDNELSADFHLLASTRHQQDDSRSSSDEVSSCNKLLRTDTSDVKPSLF